jgi:hypothetical protein
MRNERGGGFCLELVENTDGGRRTDGQGIPIKRFKNLLINKAA